jgi:alkanesulfonate monooxygenase SsuD/methylene tetrahydromethanopterin reductase-like flavin-dependent oxidoreductase (luciferase family)
MSRSLSRPATQFAWTVPTRHPGITGTAAVSRYEQIARGADQAGFDALYLPWDDAGDSTLVVAGILARATRQTRIIVETHAGAGSPVYLAKLFATAQRAASGRLDLAQRARAPHEKALDERDAAARLVEFARVFRGVWNEQPVAQDDDTVRFDVDGRFFQVEAGGLRGILSGQRLPRLYRPADQTGDATVYGTVITQRPTAGHALAVGILTRVSEAEARADAAQTGVNDGIVGSHAQTIDALAEAIGDGVTEFVFRAADPIADLYRVAENVLPALDAGRRVGDAEATEPADTRTDTEKDTDTEKEEAAA